MTVGEIAMSGHLSTPSAIQVVALDGTNRRTLVQTSHLSGPTTFDAFPSLHRMEPHWRSCPTVDIPERVPSGC